jgi:hypothetical protein
MYVYITIDSEAKTQHGVMMTDIVAQNGGVGTRQEHIGDMGVDLAGHTAAGDGRPAAVLEIEARVSRPEDLAAPDGDVRSCGAPYPAAVHAVHNILLDQQRVEREPGEAVSASALFELYALRHAVPHPL